MYLSKVMIINSESPQAMGGRSSAPQDIASLCPIPEHLKAIDGSSFATFISAIKSLPSGITLWRLNKPVRGGKRMVLSFPDFKRLYLMQHILHLEYRKLGIPYYVVGNSAAFYGMTIADVTRRVSMISRLTMQGNKNAVGTKSPLVRRAEAARAAGQTIMDTRTLSSGLRIVMLTERLPDGRRQVLHKEDFDRYYLQEEWSGTRFHAAGASNHIVASSVNYYGVSAEVRTARRARNTARGTIGNQSGRRTQPRVLVRKSKLLKMLERGYAVEQMARELKTSVFLVRRNLHHWKLTETGGSTKKLSEDLLISLEAYKTSKVNPDAFENCLYVAHLHLVEMRYLASSHRRNSKRAQHISFTVNTAENLFALALLREKIQHFRQYKIVLPEVTRVVDFYFPQWELVLEIDGSIHALPHNATHDHLVSAALMKHGYALMRLTGKLVTRDPQAALQQLLSVLNRLA